LYFTLINLNSDVNNPPNPPYINLTNFINYKEEIKDKISDIYIKSINDSNSVNQEENNTKKQEIVKGKITDLKNILSKYEYYNNGNHINSLISLEQNRSKPIDQIMKLLYEIIKDVGNNKLLTLIGSLETTEHYQNIASTENTCSFNKELPDEHYGFKMKRNKETSQQSFNVLFK